MKGRAAANLCHGGKEVEAHWPDTQRWNQLLDRNEQNMCHFFFLHQEEVSPVRVQPGRWR